MAGAAAAALALALIAAAGPVSPLGLAAGATMAVLLLVRDPATWLLALVPFAALANLEGWRGGDAAYPSEAILLAGVAAVALRRPADLSFARSWPALLYGGWIAAAALASALSAAEPDRGAAARLLRIAFLAATLFALGRSQAARGSGPRVWIRAAAAAGGLLGALAVAEALLRSGSGVPRVGSPVGSSELLALHLTLLAPPALMHVVRYGRQALGTAILVAMAGLGLALSFSRSGWVAAWVAILGMGLAAIKADSRSGRRLLLLALGLVAGAAIAAAGLAPLGGAASAYSARLATLAGLDLIQDRSAEWGRGLAAVRSHPWFGDPGAANPYNLLLGLAAASGLPVLVPFAIVLASALRAGWSGARRGGPAAVGLLGAAIALLVAGIGESTLGARLTPPAFATLGLLAGLPRGRTGGRP